MAENTSQPTVDRRVQRTRRDLKAALQLLLSQPTTAYAELSVQDICAAANLGRATFYNHFRDKDDLLWALLQDQFVEIAGSMGELNPETLLVDGKPLTYVVFVHVAAHAAVFKAVLGHEQGSSQLALRLQEYLAAASYAAHAPLRACAQQQSVPAEMIAHFLSGAVIGVLRWWLSRGCEPDATAMAYHFSLLAAPGILTTMGLDVPE